MQVFVPSCDSFAECVRVLDKRRLAKQLLEVSQLLDAMVDKPTLSGKPRTGWKNHPAYIAWSHHFHALAAYGIACADECHARNVKSDTLRQRIEPHVAVYDLPAWWGDERIHSSHRARLLTKDYDYYSQWGWTETEWTNLTECDYLWPIWESDSVTEYRLEIRKSKLSAQQIEGLASVAEHIRAIQAANL